MKIPYKASGMALSFLLLCASVQAASTVTYGAVLSAEGNASPGTGTATFVYDQAARELAITIAFTGLLSPTTVAHVHATLAAPFTGTASPATQVPTFVGFPVGVTSGLWTNDHYDLSLASSYNPSFITANGGTTEGAEAALIAAMSNGRAYINIHTEQFRGGEIRGFITTVPDGGTTLAFLIPGLLMAIGYTYRQRLQA